MSPERLAGVWGVWGARGGRHVALLAHRAATQRHAQIQTGGKIQAMLDEYALSLASQGCLQSALQAVQGSAGDLKERLQRALGIIRDPGRPQAQYQNRTRTTSGLPPARPYNQHSDVTPQYNSAVPAQYEPSWQQPPAPPRQYAPPPAPAPPLAPPTAQPPRPGSVGPTAGGITSRSKYKVDPSVQSAPLYNQYGFNNQQPQPYFNNQPEPYQPNTFAPIAPTQPNPVNGGFYNPPVDMGVAALPPVSKPVAPGWNDPPMLSKPKPKSETPVPTQAPITHPLFGVEPPQHVPLNPAPGQYPGQQPGQFLGQQPGQFPGQQPGQFPGQQPGQFPGSQQMGGQFPGSQQMGSQFPGGQYPGSQFPGGYQDQYQAQYQPPQQYTPQPEPAPVAPAAPAPPAPKAPLPSHLAPIQETFDGLREQLAQHSNNQLVKRKLEDVQRRLETLYDMLREDRLSDSCISSLHDMCRSVAAGDAGGAARGAALLAGGTDFASVASFLPALKTLFTLAEQLR